MIKIYSIFLYFPFLIFSFKLNAQQNVSISDVSSTPNASSVLDVNSSTKGLLIPRVALTATNAAAPITLPETSLLVYNTATNGASPTNVAPGYYYNAGTPTVPNWVRLYAGPTNGAEWKLLGNAGTVAPNTGYGNAVNNNFLGTTDAIDVTFVSNNLERMRIKSDNADNLRIGMGTAFTANYTGGNPSLLHLNDWGNTSNDYAQLALSTANPTLGDKIGVINFAFSGTSSIGTTANRRTASIESYLTLAPTTTLSGDLRFFTNNIGTVSEKMRIQSDGNIGIATTAPTQKLDIDGQIRIRQGNPGVGKVLTSDANGTATWEVPTSGGNTVGATYFNTSRQVFDASTTVSLTQEVTETTWIVPAGVTNIRVQIAGGGGGGGYGSSSATSGSCAGFVIGELAVTPGETLTIRVGRGGTGYNSGTNPGRGGAGSSILRGTVLLAAAGGGGGGSSNGNTDGFGGGGSYGTNINGANGTSTNGGTGGQNFIAYLRNSHAYAGARSVQGTTGPATGVTARFFTSLYDVSNNNRNYGYGGSFGGGTRGVVIIDF